MDEDNLIEVTTISSPQRMWMDTSSNKFYVYTDAGWARASYKKDIEWEDCFPDFNKVKKLCENNPGLSKAYENFKTIYKLVESEAKKS